MRAVQLGLACLLYLCAAIGLLRDPLSAPSERVPMAEVLKAPQYEMSPLVKTDQRLTIARLAHNARSLPFDLGALWDGHQCYPTPSATALGEHMLALGLIGAVPLWLSGDPIVAYNVAIVLYLFLAGLAMYLAVGGLTGSFPAALVAGLLFEIYPVRVLDAAHIYVGANHWMPLAILFAARLVARARWRDAAAMTAFVVLQVLEGAYPMMALGIFGGAFGAYLICGHTRELGRLVPKLAASALAILGAAGPLLYSYVRLNREWGIEGREVNFFLDLGFVAPGGLGFPGLVLLGLACVGAVDGIRTRRSRSASADDPRLGLLLASALVAWFSVRAVPLPGTDLELPSLYTLLSAVMPLDMVRAPWACISALYVGLGLLAGYGARALVGARGPRTTGAITAGLMAAGGLEVAHPTLSSLSFGAWPRIESEAVERPSPELLELYTKLAPGPVIDLPLPELEGLRFLLHSQLTLDGAFHGHPIGACYNSYVVQIQHDLQALTTQVPGSPEALEALRALGFTNVLDHAYPWRPPAALPPPAQRVGRAGNVTLFTLASDLPVRARFDSLEAGEPPSSGVRTKAGTATLPVTFRNARSDASYRHPDPILPSDLVARWLDASGAPVLEAETRALLPLALAPGASFERDVEIDTPAAPGPYTLELRRRDAPTVVARLRVQVEP